VAVVDAAEDAAPDGDAVEVLDEAGAAAGEAPGALDVLAGLEGPADGLALLVGAVRAPDGAMPGNPAKPL
jgi:hypothetical protein